MIERYWHETADSDIKYRLYVRYDHRSRAARSSSYASFHDGPLFVVSCPGKVTFTLSASSEAANLGQSNEILVLPGK